MGRTAQLIAFGFFTIIFLLLTAVAVLTGLLPLLVLALAMAALTGVRTWGAWTR